MHASAGKYEDAKRMAAERRRRAAKEQRVQARRDASLATVTAVRLRSHSRTAEDDERRRAKPAEFLKFRTGPLNADEEPPSHERDGTPVAAAGKYEDAKRMAADRRKRLAEAIDEERRAEDRRDAALATVTAVRLRSHSRASEDDERRRAKSAEFLKFRTGPLNAAVADEEPPSHERDGTPTAAAAAAGKYEDAKRMAADRRKRLAETIDEERRAEDRRDAALATVTAVRIRSPSEDDERGGGVDNDPVDMSLMDQMFPANHKTVFVVDHTPYFGLASNAQVLMDFTKRSPNDAVLSPLFKSMWTCSIEAVLEYCRIVWDLFSDSKVIRVVSSDVQSRNLNSWAAAHQNINHMLHHLSLLGPPAKLMPNPSRDYSVVYGFRTAAEAMSECTTAQTEHVAKKNNIEVQNKCRSIIITSARDNPSIDNLTSMFHNELIKVNKYAAQHNSMPIHHCHLVIVNTYPDSISCEVTNRNLHTISPLLDLEVHSIPASKISIKVSNLLLKHYNLGSTTVTGIPMKEEQNASSSANYDVEIYHAATAHTTILNANVADAKVVVAKKEGADYETIKLKWCTPRANNNLPDIHSCTTLHKITPVDINSRPSACLITFLLNGRSVLLEMIKQGGGKSMSHVLKSYNNEIYIHTVSSGRTVLEDPPSISEGPGGKVTQYRVADFGAFMKSNILQPAKRKVGEDDSKEKLKRQTAFWPLTTSSTIICNLKQYTEPLLLFMVKDNLSDQEMMDCKQCIYTLVRAETKNEHLIMPSQSNPRKIIKKDDQYKSMWSELETFLKSNLYSENHCKVLQCLFECRGKLDEEKIIEKTLLRFKKSLAERPSVIRATTDSPMSPPLTQQKGLKSLTTNNVELNSNCIMYLKLIQEQDSRKINPLLRPQFAGRLKSVQMRNGNLFTKLYQHLDDDSDTKSMK